MRCAGPGAIMSDAKLLLQGTNSYQASIVQLIEQTLEACRPERESHTGAWLLCVHVQSLNLGGHRAVCLRYLSD